MSTDATTIDRPGLAERERVLALLRAKEPELRAIGVMRLRLFGSLARGEAGPESDVDLLAEIDHSSRFSLLDLVGLQRDLGHLIGRKVEIATAVEDMRPRIRRRVEADALEIF
jgi:predicted nucleotidyltransferase